MSNLVHKPNQRITQKAQNIYYCLSHLPIYKRPDRGPHTARQAPKCGPVTFEDF